MTTTQVTNTARWSLVFTALAGICTFIWGVGKLSKQMADIYVVMKVDIEQLKNKDNAHDDKLNIQKADIAELRGKFTDNDHKNENQDLKIQGCELDINRLKLKIK